MKIRRIIADEVIVPARPDSVNSPGLDRPLHKLPVAGRPAWTRQFDELPKCILQMELADGTVALGECYRDHDWRIIESIAGMLIGRDVESLCPQLLGLPRCREADGFECAVWDAKAIDADPAKTGLSGSPTQVVKIFTPPRREKGEMIEGEIPEIVNNLFDKLKSTNVL